MREAIPCRRVSLRTMANQGKPPKGLEPLRLTIAAPVYLFVAANSNGLTIKIVNNAVTGRPIAINPGHIVRGNDSCNHSSISNRVTNNIIPSKSIHSDWDPIRGSQGKPKVFLR